MPVPGCAPWASPGPTPPRPAGRMVLTVFAGIAEFERALIQERTGEWTGGGQAARRPLRPARQAGGRPGRLRAPSARGGKRRRRGGADVQGPSRHPLPGARDHSGGQEFFRRRCRQAPVAGGFFLTELGATAGDSGTARVATCPESLPSMPTLKLHYDGWIALPVRLRQALGLNSGDRLEAELADGALVLRPVGKTRGSAPDPDTADSDTVQATEVLPLTADPMPVRRGPGRPRKVTTAVVEGSATPKRGRGRPRKTALAQDPPAAAAPLSALGPPKLVKKADREAAALPADPSPPAAGPALRFRPERAAATVERRPFRNVEIRPLGPGRGHNKRPSRGTASARPTSGHGWPAAAPCTGSWRPDPTSTPGQPRARDRKLLHGLGSFVAGLPDVALENPARQTGNTHHIWNII